MSFTSCWSDVYIAAGARAITNCGDFLAASALALVFQAAGHGGPAVSGLLLAATVPLVVLAPVTGRIADRVDSRTVLVTAGIVQAAVCVALAYAGDPVQVVALVAVLACGLAVASPTLAALLPAMVRPADLPRASGISQTANLLGMMAAPALAGLLVGQFGARVPLLLDAASYLSLVVAGIVLRTRRGAVAGRRAPSGAVDAGSAPAGVSGAGGDASGARWRLLGDRLVAVTVGATAAVVLGVGAINVVEVFFVRDTLGASTTMFGLVSASWAAGMLGGAVLFGRLGDRWPAPATLVRRTLLLLAGTCVPIVAGATVGSAWLLVPLWLIGGLGNGGLNVLTTVLIAGRVPERARGRAFAAMGAAVQGAALAGFVAGGLLVDRYDPRALVAACGAAGLVAALACFPVVRREARRSPVTGVAVPRGDSVGV